MKRLIAGNWKMNGTLNDAVSLAQNIVSNIREDAQILEKNDFLVSPPFHHLIPVQAELNAAVSLGAQDCSPFENGAYTGDISAAMLKDASCGYAILGHSERRQYYAESNLLIQQKAVQALNAGLKTIICVGETLEEREAGHHKDIVEQQIAGSVASGATAENTVIAYEPVWAIGTGKVASIDDITEMHDFIKGLVADGTRLLYGGSVKPANAGEIFAVPHVHGALIGGASLKAEDFIGIAQG